ncbi:hypothetical protein SAY87_015027 [Trapa incisa]|uniref:DUF4378 domain-containing protein n=1 Tax=Trapa incisa TaxID=236973 RepID=A0AAN7GPJ7_9MYRT|nr:hypothetical protein SAY87_015027 [Trapa incisa]
MTKPSQRRSVRYDQSGFMWGLIHILDFRHASRSTRKHLADKQRGSRLKSDAGNMGFNPKLSTNLKEKFVGTLGGEESFQMAAAGSPANMASMKVLIEEEMVCELHTGDKISNSNLHHEEHIVRKRNWKRRKKSRGSLGTDIDNLNGIHESSNYSKFPCNHTPDEGSVNKQNHHEVILEEFCNHINQKGVAEASLKMKPKNIDLEVNEKLHDAINKFIAREVANEKDLRENGRVNFSKEVVDTLQFRNLNEESFLKLLHDPKFMSMNNAGTFNLCKDNGLKDSERVCHSNHNSSKHHKFFRKHMKFQEVKPPEKESNGSDTNTIVILKPGPNALKSYATESRADTLSDSSQSQQVKRARAYFFITEIKKMWRNVMGKEHNVDTTLKRRSFRFRGETPERKSLSKDRFFIEKITKPRDLKVSSELKNAGISKQFPPNIYIEAKRHLFEMLSSGYEEVDSSSGVDSPRTLARILALSEFNSPIPSPARNLEQSFVTAQMRSSGDINNQFRQISGNVEKKMVENNGSCLISSTKGAEPESNNMVTHHTETEEEALFAAAREDMASDGNMRKMDEIALGECIYVDGSSKLISFPITQCVGSTYSSETDYKDGVPQNKEEEVLLNNQSPLFSFESPPHVLITKAEITLDISGDKPERPSPVSVLEPLFMDEEISPARTTSRSVEQLVGPLGIKFEDTNNFNPPEQGNLFKSCLGSEEDILLLYVRSVLQACGLNWNELYLKSQSSFELLEPSSYGEIDFFSNHPQYDQDLVFDCINEILLVMIDDHFQFCPLLSFINPIIRPVPDLNRATGEVWQQVHYHILQMPLPRTLDQIVHRDMKNENRMDLRACVEGIGFEMGDEILDDLIKDYVENLHSLHASILVNIEEKESTSA